MNSLSIQQSIRKFCHLFETHDGESKELTGSSASRKCLEQNFWQQLLRKDRPVSPSCDLEQRLESAALDIFLRQEGSGDSAAVEAIEKFHKNAALLCATEDGHNVLEFLLALQGLASHKIGNTISQPQRGSRKVTQGFFGKLLADEKIPFANHSNGLSAACRDLFKEASRKKRDNSAKPSSTFAIFNPAFAFDNDGEEQPAAENDQQHSPFSLPKEEDSRGKAQAERKTSPRTFVGNLLTSRELHGYHTVSNVKKSNGSRLSTENFQAELAKVIVGIPSTSFDFDESNEYRLQETVHVIGLDRRIVEDLAGFAAVVGNSVRRIRSFIKDIPQNNGQTFLRFIQACKVYLDGFVAVISGRCNTGNFISFQDSLQSLISPIEFLEEVCVEVGEVKAGLNLLQVLYEKCMCVVGDRSLLHLALFLLEESAVPFFHFVTSLALRGHVASALVFAEEFGVLINEGALHRPKVAFWDDVFVTNDIPETFLTEFCLRALEAARCLLLLKAVRPFHPLLFLQTSNDQASPLNFCLCFTEDSNSYFVGFQWYGEDMRQKLDRVTQKELKRKTFVTNAELADESRISFGSVFSNENMDAPKAGAKPEDVFERNWKNHHGSFKAIIHRKILPVIDIQVRLAEKAVVKLFFDTLRISDHINVIRNYFFLENGEFAATFSSNLFEKASRSSLKGCLEVSFLLFCFDTSLSDQVRRDEKVNKRLTLLSTRPSDVPTTVSPYDLTDFLGLDYKVDWPLNMILTPDLMLKCNAVFRRLLRIKGCIWTLNDTFLLLNEVQDVQNEGNRSFLSVVRHEIAHVIRVLDVHLMDVAVHRSWRESQAPLEGDVTSFEELREAVRLYVNNVHEKCILEDAQGSRFAWVLSEILRYTLRFYAELKAEASIEELRKTYAVFQQCVHFILDNVEKRRGVPIDFDCETFLSHIDFNNYYRNNKTSSGTEKSPGKNRSRSLLRNLYGTL
ncbi:hypothetical protein RvY_10926 [Ramazzottius varieornatus]|uniref:Gamma-tubulin complex component n=1 Tax=Ramazzottius varieornatus TaxID=947166 RepID=A0A1D1VNC0_RAMVA|nr:hypothetical protein RvY_10926 [Ramazzottius varieornatus]